MAGLMVSPTLQCNRCSFAGRPLRQQMASPAPARCRTPLAVMAKLSKAADFRGLSQEQIHEQVQTAKRELFDLRIKQKTKQEFLTSDFGKLKLKIAQLLTVSREQEMKDGQIDRRDWRRKQKQERVAAGFPQF